MIYTFLLWTSTENLKTTPFVILRLGGYDDMIQQVLPVSANSSAPGCCREREPGPGGYCYIDENLKADRNILAHNDAAGL